MMSLPIRTFWMLNANIDRIQAQKDMRSLTVAMCGQGGDKAAQHCRQSLVIEVGEIVKLKIDPIRNAVRDEVGFAALKEMANQM